MLSAGVLREVYNADMEYPVSVECYTIPEAARALGRTELTFKRWIEEDLIPGPVLFDTTHNYRQYSVGELTVLMRELQEHEREFTYYSGAHTARRERIMQHLFAYRQHHV